MRPRLLLILFLLIPVLAQAKTHAQIADENARSVVAVNVLRQDGTSFTGTGFVVSPNGLIATARHVAQNALYMNVTFNTGAVSGEARPVARAARVDLALLKIEAQRLPTVKMGDSDRNVPGEIITVIGNPRRLQNTISSGLISQIRKKADGVIWHQISAPISPSSSGSPVFNEKGEVISVAFSSYKGEENQNLNFSIPINYLAEMMQEIGYLPPRAPQPVPTQSASGFQAHLQKAWDMTKRLFQNAFEDKNKPAA